MKFLSPSDYSNWPAFRQRICFAYNSVPHDSLEQVSPFEMDFGMPAVSAFAPPHPDYTHDEDNTDDDSQQALPVPTTLSPTTIAEAIKISVAAFHRYAHTHHRYLQQTTADRLNLQGTPTSFQLDERVKIYMPPNPRSAPTYRPPRETHRILARTLSHHRHSFARHL